MATTTADTPYPTWGSAGHRRPLSQALEHPAPAATEQDAVAALEASPRFAAAFLVAWVATGLVTAYVLRRRGHDMRPTAALGLVLGPLFIPLARGIVREREALAPARVLSGGRRSRGSVDVVVGLLGPGERVGDVRPVLDLLGDCLGRVTVAAAVDYESAASDDWCGAKLRAVVELEVAAALLADRWEAATVLVPGRPDRASVRYASDTGHDLVVLAGAPGARTGARPPAVPARNGGVAVVVPPGRRGPARS